VNVTPLVTGNGTVTIRASGNSSDGTRYYSRNGNPASLASNCSSPAGDGPGHALPLPLVDAALGHDRR
jgi:hypothetical protein